MKIQPFHSGRRQRIQSTSEGGLVAPEHREGGIATLIYIVLLAIMMLLVTAEARSLIQLRQEMKLLEQQQIKRLHGTLPQTNSISTNAQP